MPMHKTQEMSVRTLSQEDPLEKKRAIHSSILAWKILLQRSLAGYSACSRKRVGYDLASIYEHSINTDSVISGKLLNVGK